MDAKLVTSQNAKVFAVETIVLDEVSRKDEDITFRIKIGETTLINAIYTSGPMPYDTLTVLDDQERELCSVDREKAYSLYQSYLLPPSRHEYFRRMIGSEPGPNCSMPRNCICPLIIMSSFCNERTSQECNCNRFTDTASKTLRSWSSYCKSFTVKCKVNGLKSTDQFQLAVDLIYTEADQKINLKDLQTGE